MKINLLLLVCAICAVFSSCKWKTDDGECGSIQFVYQNESSHFIRIEMYEDDELIGIQGIPKSGSISYLSICGEGEMLIQYDAVRVVFVETKELWYHKETDWETQGTIYNTDSYQEEKIGPFQRQYTYTFTDSDFESATDIP